MRLDKHSSFNEQPPDLAHQNLDSHRPGFTGGLSPSKRRFHEKGLAQPLNSAIENGLCVRIANYCHKAPLGALCLGSCELRMLKH